MNVLPVFLISSFALFFLSCGDKQTQPTVAELDLNRYMGTWYEIARLDNSFERGLVGVTATYSLKENGGVKVVNQGYKDSLNGKLSRVVGKAKRPNDADPGKLKVSFFAFFYAPYWVLELDTADYQYALVGGPGNKYLWLLSRTTEMNDEIYTRLINKAASLGYPVDELIKVQQPK